MRAYNAKLSSHAARMKRALLANSRRLNGPSEERYLSHPEMVRCLLVVQLADWRRCHRVPNHDRKFIDTDPPRAA